MDALLGALGALFASGVGLLFLVVVAASMVVLWNWRVAVVGLVVLHVGVGSMLVHIHNVPGLVVAGQFLAATLAAAMLAIAGAAAERSPSLRRSGNWPLRISALVFVTAAWWFIDPGLIIPQFSQPETDLLVWVAICGLLIICMTSNPTFTGIALLLWCAPLYAIAAVLLPGSGLPALAGIAELLLALACAYLALIEPTALGAGTARKPRWPLPAARTQPLPAVIPTAATAPVAVPNPLTAANRRAAPTGGTEATPWAEKTA